MVRSRVIFDIVKEWITSLLCVYWRDIQNRVVCTAVYRSLHYLRLPDSASDPYLMSSWMRFSLCFFFFVVCPSYFIRKRKAVESIYSLHACMYSCICTAYIEQQQGLHLLACVYVHISARSCLCSRVSFCFQSHCIQNRRVACTVHISPPVRSCLFPRVLACFMLPMRKVHNRHSAGCGQPDSSYYTRTAFQCHILVQPAIIAPEPALVLLHDDVCDHSLPA